MPFVLFVKKATEAMGRPSGDFTLKMAKKGERRTVQCGISTACFYPQDTMEALSKTQQLAPPCMEIFLNTFRELEPDYVQRLAAQLRSRNTNLISVHPFSSSMETFFFFSEYTPRFEDGLRLYRRYFEVCRMLGAHILVLHGNVKNRPLPPQEHARRLCRLAAEGEKFGVTVAYENVVRCQCGDPQQVLALRQCADRPVRFVLDLKQARRAGVTAVDAQIETVRANYEDVKAQAQAKIDARKKAEAAAAKKKAQAAAAAAKAKAAQQAKINKRNEEKAELQMELLRLDVQKKKAQVGADAAMSNATAERAKDFVDNQVEEGRAKIDQIKAQSEAIRAGTAK